MRTPTSTTARRMPPPDAALTRRRALDGPTTSLALLHTTMLLRVVADLAVWERVREVTGVGKVTALVVFAAVMVAATRRREKRGHRLGTAPGR